MITEARHLVDAPAGNGRAWAWHGGRWLLSLTLALVPLWVGTWHAQPRLAGPPPLELSIVRLPPVAPSVPTPAQPGDTPSSAARSPTPAPAAPPPAVAGLAASSPEAVPTPAAPPRPAADPLLAAAPPSQPEETTPRSEAAPPPAETMAPVAETLQAQAASANPAAPAAPSVTREAAPPSPDQPVDAEALDAGFRLLSRGPLTYPGRARRLSRGGEARVEVGVDPTGRVSGVTVLHETRGWGFGEAARAAYAQARFTPPTVNGRPVHVRWRKTLRFQP